MRAPVTATAIVPTDLAARFRAVRDQTEALASVLSPEDQVVQSMPDVSPTKWHRAHTTWFFETFLLAPHGVAPVEEYFGYLFNSYYESVGDRHPRSERGLVTRPSVAEVAEYRRRVDESMVDLLDRGVADDPAVAELLELGLQHEQQHQELLLMDIKHVLSRNPYSPTYRPQATPLAGVAATDHGWVSHPGGIVDIGHHGDGFHFDNEGPCHQVLVQPHRLGDRLVTNGEWLAFMADGGYDDPALWLSAGWHAVTTEGWRSPLYWQRDDEWTMHTLTGTRAVDPAEPVVHVSYFEADAFARWAGARLPTEFEWEARGALLPVEGNLLPADRFHPAPPPAATADDGVRQMFGDVWEWTSSAYAPYPRYAPAAGAVGEYNGKFMVDQQVLRGGACVTPGGHVRATYRNFFPTHSRWMFAGVRLADDGGAR